ncbi:unnamed protein product [Orchesella dallaii]|uniref:Uncharacterized protein n=1 Tax=Orchesella dallaii TaxID=48710 RepID=A0ABP1PPF7_9HEXA
MSIQGELIGDTDEQNFGHPGDRITILGYNFDTGATIATFASIAILSFPMVTGTVPLVRRSDPASHMSIILFQNNSILMQRIFASVFQGGTTIFGAIPCLQILLLATAIIVEFGGMMGDASKIHNPWLAFQLLKANTVHTHVQKWKINVADRRLGLTTKQEKLNGEQDPNVISIKVLAANKIVNSRNHRKVIMKWKEIYYKMTCFRPSLLLHRQMTILSTIMGDALMFYSPALILTSICIIIVTVFFPLRFNPPIVVQVPCLVIAVTMTGIIFILVPTGSLVVRSSNQFTKFWRLRLRTPINRQQLKSCRQIAIWIGHFGYFHEGTLLLVLNIILTYLSTLLINVKVKTTDE